MTDALKPEDTRDALRKIGLLLFALGAAMLFFRKADDWADFPLFLVLAIPAVLLYGGALWTIKDTGSLQPWQAVSSVVGLLFVPLAFLQFIELVNGDTSSQLNQFWIWGVTAALAFFAAIAYGVRFHLLAGSLLTIVSWSALWDKLLGDEGIGGHVGVYRGLLGILSILLLAGGVFLWRKDRNDGLSRFSEMLTGAGVAAVLACGLGVTSVGGGFLEFFGLSGIGTNVFWDVLLLVISLGLVGIGSRIGTRGPVYVGAIGLLLFLAIVGADVDDDSPEPGKLGLWPLILLIGGGAAVVASLSKGVSLGKKPRDLVKKISQG